MEDKLYQGILRRTVDVVESGLEYTLGERILFAEVDLMDASSSLFTKGLTEEQVRELRMVINPLKMELGY